MKKITFLLLTFVIVFASCEPTEDQPDTEQKTVKIDKHAAVDVKINQIQLDSAVEIITDKYFYDNGGNLLKTITTYDTVPSLGTIKDTLDTGRTYNDEDGVEWEKDTIITHKKNYQFFVTIK